LCSLLRQRFFANYLDFLWRSLRTAKLVADEYGGVLHTTSHDLKSRLMAGQGENVMKKWLMLPLALISLGFVGKSAFAQAPEIVFNLVPQPKFLSCLGVPYGPAPTAEVIVQRGELNDILILRAHNLKPNLGFDLFTIQNTNLLSNGEVDPKFKNFGLAWYQTDVQADGNGEAEVAIKTILLDQIFGFDPAASLLPTHTFHVGFWFNKPEDAEACGFNPKTPTPFNGEQDAGPNAMISLPNLVTDLGPLCTNPRKEGSRFVCHE
jgi:hypothetical protein